MRRVKLDPEVPDRGVDGVDPLGEDLVDRGVLPTPAAEENLDRPAVDARRAPCQELETRMSRGEEAEWVFGDGHPHHLRVPLVDVMPCPAAHELETVRDAVPVSREGDPARVRPEVRTPPAELSVGGERGGGTDRGAGSEKRDGDGEVVEGMDGSPQRHILRRWPTTRVGRQGRRAGLERDV